MRPLVYVLTDLHDPEIRCLFPKGASITGPGNRWKPAETPEEATKSLDDLLLEKRRREYEPRLLKARYSRDNYTTEPSLAMQHEGEAPPKAEIDERAEQSRLQFEVVRAGEHERRLAASDSLERQLTEAIAVARLRGIDVHADIQFIRRRIDRMKQKVQESANPSAKAGSM